MNMRWLLITLGLSATLTLLHLYALENFIYWHYRWFDIPMHILGGAVAGAFLVALIRPRALWTYTAGILFVAVGWEIFEYIFRISTGQADYYFDTMHDIVNDGIGALIIYYLAKKTLWRSV